MWTHSLAYDKRAYSKQLWFHVVYRLGDVLAWKAGKQVSQVPLPSYIWKIGTAATARGAVEPIIFRVSHLIEDDDGSPRTYHEPTATSWDGKPPGRDSLLDALSYPAPQKQPFPYKDDETAEAGYPLTSGCPTVRAFYKAKALSELSDPSAKDALSKILAANKCSNLNDLQKKSDSAVCVKKIGDRVPTLKDWVKAGWAGVVAGPGNIPKTITGLGDGGFLQPNITPEWADPDEHPWAVFNPLIGHYFGTNIGNSVAVIDNSKSPRKIACGILADSGPVGEMGECSSRMLVDLESQGCPNRDYIFIEFPEPANKAKVSGDAARDAARKVFDTWTFDGKQGIDVVQDLFPTLDEYNKMQKEFSKQWGKFAASTTPFWPVVPTGTK